MSFRLRRSERGDRKNKPTFVLSIENVERARGFFAKTEVDPAECAGCMSLLETPDAFSTGDSPTKYECQACYPLQCFRVRQQLKDFENERVK